LNILNHFLITIRNVLDTSVQLKIFDLLKKLEFLFQLIIDIFN